MVDFFIPVVDMSLILKDKTFWIGFGVFDREAEFTKVPRNSIIFMEDGTKLPYPIENYAYLFDEKMKISFIEDLIF